MVVDIDLEIARFMEKKAENAPSSEDEYLAEDGLLHCRKCNEKVQTEFEVNGKKIRFRCICKCKVDEMDAQKEKEHQQELERMRNVCFNETNMASWTFENDDKENPNISKAMMNYADKFEDFKEKSKGLLLYGTVGTGKTYYAACIANRLIDKGYHVLMTNFSSLTNQIQGTFDGKQEFINSLNRYSLLIIDDLGAERKSEFMQEMVFNIIDSRYRSGLPFIITTNLTADEIKKPQDIGYQRIYDRILERCFPVEVTGSSRRRKALKESHADVKKILGM